MREVMASSIYIQGLDAAPEGHIRRCDQKSSAAEHVQRGVGFVAAAGESCVATDRSAIHVHISELNRVVDCTYSSCTHTTSVWVGERMGWLRLARREGENLCAP
eukprot:SAG31_NODE_4548_length_3149_cov_1.504918_5_plen_104_part_00